MSQIGCLKLLITGSILSGPLDFEIKRVTCIFFIILKLLSGKKRYVNGAGEEDAVFKAKQKVSQNCSNLVSKCVAWSNQEKSTHTWWFHSQPAELKVF